MHSLSLLRWYRWNKQYMWHELWFRTHVIILCCCVVIFAYERGFPGWFPPVVIIIFLGVTIGLKYTSTKVEDRVPSSDDKRQLYSNFIGTMRSTSDAFNELKSSSDVASDDANTSPLATSNGSEAQLSDAIELQDRKQTAD